MRRREFIRAAAGTLAALPGLKVRAAAEAKIAMPDLVIVVPGIMGSTLTASGRSLWGPSVGAITALLDSLATHRSRLTLTGDSSVAEDLDDGVTADALMPDFHLIPGFWKVDGYTKLKQDLLSTFDLRERQNYFEFPYDWRRDNRAAARRLKRTAQEWLSTWRKSSSNPKAKLVFVCHSMGGLVARYFLECLGGWSDSRALITFGTPFRGSMKALDFVANGFSIGGSDSATAQIAELAELVRSFTSAYQLMPTYPSVSLEGARPKALSEIHSIPNLSQTRVREALTFHAEIDKAILENKKNAQYINAGYSLCPVVGISQPTLVLADLVGKSLRPITNRTILGGDGTVPRLSAIPSAHTDAHYFAEQHGSLQNFSPAFVQLAGFLTGDLIGEGPPAVAQIELDCADAYSTRTGIKVRATKHGFSSSSSPTAILTNADQTISAPPLKMTSVGDNDYEATWQVTDAGGYRVTVSDNDVATTGIFIAC